MKLKIFNIQKVMIKKLLNKWTLHHIMYKASFTPVLFIKVQWYTRGLIPLRRVHLGWCECHLRRLLTEYWTSSFSVNLILQSPEIECEKYESDLKRTFHSFLFSVFTPEETHLWCNWAQQYLVPHWWVWYSCRCWCKVIIAIIFLQVLQRDFSSLAKNWL